MNMKPIHNDRDNDKAIEHIEALFEIVMDKGEENTPKEVLNEIEVLGILIDEYERKRYPIGKTDPIVAIKFEMEQRSLVPKDMTKYFGSSSRYYDVINGKRNLSIAMIKKLHQGLNMPYECLLPA